MAVALALITCFMIIPLGGLAVDIGMQRVARSDMQTVADMAATDMARVLGKGTTPTAAMAAASASRASGAIGATPTMNVYLGVISSSAPFVSSQSRGCGGSPYDNYFQAVPSGGTANAVVVTASTKVSFVIDAGSGGTCRSALARVSGSVCYELGSYAAAVNSGDSSVLAPLNDIFGLNFQLLSYQNIAGAKLTLGQLAADSHFGTATQLLGGSIKVSDLVLAMIDVLQQGSGNTAAITALNSMLSTVATLPAIPLTNAIGVS
ncbi:MAG: pilus assembly protein TadG-related protein, partial [Marmoricola sp.]